MNDPFCHEILFEKQSGIKEEASGTEEFLERETSRSEHVILSGYVVLVSFLLL